MTWLDNRNPHTQRITIASLGFCFAMAYIAEQYFGIADITGAYIAGIVLCLSLIHIWSCHNKASCAMGIAEIVPAHTCNFSRDDAVYWRKDTDDECPRISQISGAGIFA